jgi:imidazolonepropionase-like amidohydrolase
MQTIKMLITVAAAILIGGFASAVHAQDLLTKAPPQAGPIALIGATVHPVSGPPIEDAMVSFVDGVIRDVGPRDSTPIPRGADVIDAAGLHVYPGLIGANTQMGLLEIGAVRATLDYNETGSVTPEVRAAVAVNPDTTIIPVTRSNGVLTVAVHPLGGTVPGRASIIRMDGWTVEGLTIEKDAGLVLNWPNVRPVSGWWVRTSEAEQREEIEQRLREIDGLFDQAEAYLAAREAEPEQTPMDLRWEAMRPVIEGEKRVIIRADELEQIQSAVRWAGERGLKTTILGGAHAPLCAEMLKRHDVRVIVTGTHRLPPQRDTAYDWSFTVPQQLEEAGVMWCLASRGGSFETPHERNLPYHAATAVAYGLDADAALRAITLSAAEVLDIDDRLGSIEPGKAATLILTDANPLEITTTVRRAWIDGREIDLGNKQTALAEKYREKYRQLGLTEDEDEAERLPD